MPIGNDMPGREISLKGLSRMMGNYHVRFLGGEGPQGPELPGLNKRKPSHPSHRGVGHSTSPPVVILLVEGLGLAQLASYGCV